MINATTEFKTALLNDNRRYVEEVEITLADGASFTLGNAQIWGGGFEVEDAVSSDSTFGALGATVINRASVVINNIDDLYSDFDFTNARAVFRVGLELSDRTELLQKGVYTVDEAIYNGSLITLECLDDMVKFDRAYSDSRLAYPATLGEIVRDACSVCLGSSSKLATLNFPRHTLTIQKKPMVDSLTFREVIGWCAQIAGCFARVNRFGNLELKWFDMESLYAQSGGLDGGIFDTEDQTRYRTGDRANGGSFNPWTVGHKTDSGGFSEQAEVAHIYSIYEGNFAVDDTVVSGVVLEINPSDSNNDVVMELKGTMQTYAITVSDNGFFNDNVDLGRYVHDRFLKYDLIGMVFRKAEMQHSSDPTIEAGDVAIVHTRKGARYGILVTRTSFSTGGAQTTVSASETPVRSTSTRFNQNDKNYVALRKQIVEEKTDREIMIEDLSNRLAQASGLYQTIVEVGTIDPLTKKKVTSGSIYYMHNHPDVETSDIIWKLTEQALGVSSDGGKTWNFGVSATGDTIVRILSAEGINANWIKTGVIRSQDGSVSIDLANGKVTMNGNVTIKGYVKPGDLSTAGSTSINGSNIKTGTINANLITTGAMSADRITTGSMSAARITTGTMSAARIKGGTLTLGGSSNGNGIIEIKNASAERVGRWDKDALYIGNIKDNLSSPQTKIAASGAITTKSLTAKEYVSVDGNGSSLLRIPISSSMSSTRYVEVSKKGFIARYGNNAFAADTSNGIWVGAFSNVGQSYIEAPNTRIDQSRIAIANASLAMATLNATQLNFTDDVGTTTSYYRSNSARVDGNFSVTGSKNRLVKTDSYGERLLYAYETPSPLFGDVGEGEISEDGKCFIEIDPIFAETVTLTQYQVFLQKYGDGDCWVSERAASHFVVEGTAGLKFGWELKAKQADFDQRRLDAESIIEQSADYDYGEELRNHIAQIKEKREGKGA